MLNNSALRGALSHLSLEIAGHHGAPGARADAPDRRVGAAASCRSCAAHREGHVLPIVIPPIVMGAGLAALQGSCPAVVVSAVLQPPLTGADADLRDPRAALRLPLAGHRRARDRSAHAGRRRAQPRRTWFTLIMRVILPNVRTAVLVRGVADDRALLGEVVIATHPALRTFPVEMIQVSANQPGVRWRSQCSPRCWSSCCSFSRSPSSRAQPRLEPLSG